jgi:hypothetical protein
MSSTYDVLAAILRDNDTEIAQIALTNDVAVASYRDGLQAAGQRVRAAMAGLPRNTPGYYEESPVRRPHGGNDDGGGGDDGPIIPRKPTPGGPGRVIDVDLDRDIARVENRYAFREGRGGSPNDEGRIWPALPPAERDAASD